MAGTLEARDPVAAGPQAQTGAQLAGTRALDHEAPAATHAQVGDRALDVRPAGEIEPHVDVERPTRLGVRPDRGEHQEHRKQDPGRPAHVSSIARGAPVRLSVQTVVVPRPTVDGMPEWLDRHLLDPHGYGRIACMLLALPLGIAAFVVAVTVHALPEALVLSMLGAVVLGLGIPGLSALGRLYAEVSDLRAARARIIEAADAERRRIERDLHGGAQQRLVALALMLRMAERRAAEGDPRATELVRSAGDEAGHALRELRDLARCIHPAILTNRGLPAALGDLAGRAAVPVEVVAAPAERLPDRVEAAAYLVVSECLVNIGKHAQATRATVSIRAQDGVLRVEVADDGVGGAELGHGSGLQGLEDRVGALDGRLELHSPPGAGTRLTARIPVDAAPAPALEQPAARRRRAPRLRLGARIHARLTA